MVKCWTMRNGDINDVWSNMTRLTGRKKWSRMHGGALYRWKLNGGRNFTTKLGTNCQHFKLISEVIRDV